MANTRISSADYTDMSGSVDNFSVEAEVTLPEIRYASDWPKWYGYYKNINAIQSIINRKAMWTVGKGFKTDKKTENILSKIRGTGKDSIESILYNACNTYTINGDFFAEIVKNKRGVLKNLKPLSPDLQIVANGKGIIRRYEDQASQITWTPDEIFHLSWNKIGNMFHGQGTIEKIEDIILMRKEAMTDLQKVFHRYVKPLWVFSVDTDDIAEIAAFKAKVDSTVEKSENLVVPKDTVSSYERLSIPQFSTLDPIPWINMLWKEFIISEGVPDIILGTSGEATEAVGKILYLGWQQVVEFNQKFIEQQFKNQLGYDIKFNKPISLDPQMKTDSGKAKKTNERINSAGKQE